MTMKGWIVSMLGGLVCAFPITGCNKVTKGSAAGNPAPVASAPSSGPATEARPSERPKTVPSGKVQIGLAQNARTHVEVYQQTLAVVKELAELMAGVTDAESARAARPRFDQLNDEGLACAQRMQQLGPHAAGLGDPYLRDIKRYNQEVQKEWWRINMDPAMKEALGRLRI
jgi:hypothetical protein